MAMEEEKFRRISSSSRSSSSPLSNLTSFPSCDSKKLQRTLISYQKRTSLSSSPSQSKSNLAPRSSDQRNFFTSFNGVCSDRGDDHDSGDGIAAVREKLVRELRNETQQLLEAVMNSKKERNFLKEGSEPEPTPWNLKARKPVDKQTETDNDANVCRQRPSVSPPRKNGKNSGVEDEEVEEKRVKFSVSLTKAEIEEDFLAMTGKRPPRRPKKRPRLLQRQIDLFTPASFLTEITPDMYKTDPNKF